MYVTIDSQSILLFLLPFIYLGFFKSIGKIFKKIAAPVLKIAGAIVPSFFGAPPLPIGDIFDKSQSGPNVIYPSQPTEQIIVGAGGVATVATSGGVAVGPGAVSAVAMGTSAVAGVPSGAIAKGIAGMQGSGFYNPATSSYGEVGEASQESILTKFMPIILIVSLGLIFITLIIRRD